MGKARIWGPPSHRPALWQTHQFWAWADAFALWVSGATFGTFIMTGDKLSLAGAITLLVLWFWDIQRWGSASKAGE